MSKAEAERSYIPLLSSHYEAISQMPRDEGNEFLRAIADYGFTGIEPNFTGMMAIVWTAIFPILENNRILSLSGSTGGKKGGKASKRNNPNGRRGKAAEEPEAPDGSERDEEDVTPTPQRKAAPVRFAAPSVNEVQQYITAQGYAVSAANFVDFYASKGWRVGNNPMKDWKAAVRTWQRREQEHSTAPTSTTGSPAQFTPNERGEVNVCGIIVKLGHGERIDSGGRRTYGDGRITVPQDAPRRPGSRYEWSEPRHEWYYDTF